MFNKHSYLRKSLIMSLTRKSLLYIQRCSRNFVLTKKFILIILCSLFITCILFINKKNELCDPTEHLWWFCSWPDPAKTVCSWDDHFPTISKQIRSPESYEKLFLSLPKLRSLFEYNNKTFVQCNENSIDLLIFVISKCSHFSIRQSIRRTWGNIKLLEEYFPKLKLKFLFLVDIDSKSEKKIELEYEYHHDIVQIQNLAEQYEYVTEREAALYQFIKYKCKQTKFIFKTDDDIFINTFLLLSFFNTKINSLEKYSLIGFPIKYGLVVRHTNDHVGQRYIITKDEYLCSRYPTFLSGFGYFISFQSLSLFSNAYLIDKKPFPLSDVYFTGLLPEMFNIEREAIFENIKYLYETKCNEEFFTGKTNPLACAASDDHFQKKESSNGDRSLMNDYNLYWMKLAEKYDTLRTNDHK